MNIPEVIIFLSGVTKFVPRDTVVSINEVKITVGPSGVKVLPDSAAAKYRVVYEEPIELNWKTVMKRMKDSTLRIYAGGETNIGPALSLIIRPLGLHK